MKVFNKTYFFNIVKESGCNLSGPPSTGASQVSSPPNVQSKPIHAREYSFLDIEIKYGILQVQKWTHKLFYLLAMLTRW